jgi:hypothetical protein
MKKLLIISAGFLCVAGYVFPAWAHGPNGVGSGYHNQSYSKPHFNKSFQPRSGRHFGRHHRHLHHGSLTHSKQRHLRRAQRSRRLPGIVNGVIQSKPGPLQNRSFSSPIAKAYDRGIGVSPIRKALEKQTPAHSLSSRSYHRNNPEPWFLYGQGENFRQMGLIPPLP